MRQSLLFPKTTRSNPTGAESVNHKLLVRAGFIDQLMAGSWTLLPLGWRVVTKIIQIIREEMNALGAVELSLTALQNHEVGKKSDRWDGDVWFKTELTQGGALGLGWTQEEEITELMTRHIQSYKDLPRAAYQIQTKFRNEERAKSGILRGREFLMKDLYSFHSEEGDLDLFYQRAQDAYAHIFERVGLGGPPAGGTFPTIASGGAFSKWSHEFQTLSPAGEDTIYYSKERGVAVNKEVYSPEVLEELGISADELIEAPSIEVGNIFKLGTRFSEPLGLLYADEAGERHPVVMGSYGIGPGRVMGTIVEVSSDERGIVWPEAIAPFRYHLIALPDANGTVEKEAEKLYTRLTSLGITVLYDDRLELSAGERFAEADLLGISTRLVISERTLGKGVERKDRKTGSVDIIPYAVLEP